jgi:hypothetical protein
LIKDGTKNQRLRGKYKIPKSIVDNFFPLGDPVPIVITEDEGAGAVEFFDAWLNLVSDDPLIELSDEIKKIAAVLQPEKGKNIPALGVGLIEKIDSRGSQGVWIAAGSQVG